jgi:hypothetical protein
MIRHLVLWTLTDEAKAEGIPEVIAKLDRSAKNLAGKIPGLLSSEVKPNLFTENPHDLIFYSEFEKLSDIDIYQNHPLHLEHKAMAAKYVTNRENVDIENT